MYWSTMAAPQEQVLSARFGDVGGCDDDDDDDDASRRRIGLLGFFSLMSSSSTCLHRAGTLIGIYAHTLPSRRQGSCLLLAGKLCYSSDQEQAGAYTSSSSLSYLLDCSFVLRSLAAPTNNRLRRLRRCCSRTIASTHTKLSDCGSSIQRAGKIAKSRRERERDITGTVSRHCFKHS